jgi:hypothetical protein
VGLGEAPARHLQHLRHPALQQQHQSQPRSLAGIKAGEGKIVLLCAVVAIGLGIVAMVNNAKLGLIAIAPAVIGILVMLKVFADKASYDDKMPSLGTGSSVNVSLSAGIYVSLIAAIAVIALGVIGAVTSKSG